MNGYSLDAQKDKLRKYAEYQDMTIVSEFSDEGFSGKNIKGRPEFSRMMEKIESGEDEVEIIRIMYDRYIHTNSGINGIASYLNDNGYTKKLRQNNTIPSFSSSQNQIGSWHRRNVR